LGELEHVKSDLERYANYLEGMKDEVVQSSKESSSVKSENILDPLKEMVSSIGSVFSPLVPTKLDLFYSKDKKSKDSKQEFSDKETFVNVVVCEDFWKTYTIFKKTIRIFYGA
jgi:hypothetical protein